MSLSTYLYFSGSCAEAFDHYQKVFDASELCRQTFAEGPPEMFGNDDPDWIMHTTLQIGDTMLMGSDRPGGCEEPINFGNNYSIVFRPESRDQADSLFPRLAEGGQITMALQTTFWGSYFGMCTDRFGVHWKFNTPLTNNDGE